MRTVQPCSTRPEIGPVEGWRRSSCAHLGSPSAVWNVSPRIDLCTGETLDPPAELPLARYEVVIEEGRVLIEVPEGPPEVSE